MSNNNLISQDYFQDEIKNDEFMDNAYEQITKDITKVLLEMQKEKQNLIKNNDNFNQKFFDDNNEQNYK